MSTRRNVMRKYLKFVICLIFTLIFLSIILVVIHGNNLWFDNTVYKLIISIKSDFWTLFFKVVTFFASVPFMIFITLFTLFLKISKKYKIFIACNMINDVILNNSVKYIVRRERPIEWFLVYEDGFSFPSGHMMGACCFYGAIIYLIYKSNLSKKFKYFLISFFVMLIILIGVSRIYLGVHYATDVLGGLLFSCIYLIVYITFINSKLFKSNI